MCPVHACESIAAQADTFCATSSSGQATTCSINRAPMTLPMGVRQLAAAAGQQEVTGQRQWQQQLRSQALLD